MKKSLIILTMIMIPSFTQAQAIELIIKAAVVKVIKAVDLQVQRQQNKVIWLQNAHKAIENQMSKLKLDEISDWTEKQRILYKDYYDGLAKVKSIITYHQRVRDLSEKQLRLMEEYRRAWNLFLQSGKFTADELAYMNSVYSGILQESVKNIDQILLIVKSFTTKMGDVKRLEIINAAADQLDNNFYDLVRFNEQNLILSLQRAKDQREVSSIKNLYGL